MYSHEERTRAVNLYIEYNLNSEAVVRELGYPSKPALRYWYKEYKETGELHEASKLLSRYSQEEKARAVVHYMTISQNLRETCRVLGYPHRQVLREWIDEYYPDTGKRSSGVVKYTIEQKEAAVNEMLNREKTVTVTAVAKKHGTTKASLYNWKNELLGEEIMSEEKLVVPMKKRRKYNSYAGEVSPAVENIVARDFHTDKPNDKWLTDITEFNIPAGKVYLSPIIDCFDGLAVSWSIGTSPNAELVNDMLDGAISTLQSNEKPIVHSDRGSHYRWPGWIFRMDNAGLTRSMSKKACPPDNSACEGFFGIIKNEMYYHRSWGDISIEQFINELDCYLRWYNQKRIKMSLGAMSPLEYRHSVGIVA